MPLADDSAHRNWGSYVITLSPFKMLRYEVDQSFYEAVMGTNPSNFKTNPATGEVQIMRPVEMVTWYDAVEFCIKLSEREELSSYLMTDIVRHTDGYITSANVYWVDDQYFTGYRLPTEAEWEYACRAGTTTPRFYGTNLSSDYAWLSGSYTHARGRKLGNPWGLYDMIGNVNEMVWDKSTSSSSIIPLVTSNQTNPKGPDSGNYIVMRGGSFTSVSNADLGSFTRTVNNNSLPSNRYSTRGFRIVRNQP